MPRRALPGLIAALLALVGLQIVRGQLLGDSVYAFGRSLQGPPPGFRAFLVWYALLGTIAVAGLVWATIQALPRDSADRLLAFWTAGSDRRWLLWATLLAGLLPALVRTYLLRGMALTDDEAAYRFMAQVLTTGRLWADSFEIPLAFDAPFLINDGRMYAQYFLGWPLLRALGGLLGFGAFTNCLLAALTLPPLFLLLQREFGSAWARVGAALWITSPMLLVLAATELSHTACLFALTWSLGAFGRARQNPEMLRWHALFGVAFAGAVWIRPLSALGVGLPFLVVWSIDRCRTAPPGRATGSRALAVIAFGVPAIALAALLFAANSAQNGSPLITGYDRYLEYARSNLFRFSIWPGEPTDAMREMAWRGIGPALAVHGAAWLRLNFALFGWVCSLLFVPFAGRDGRPWFASLLSFTLLHAALGNVGIDAFAPMHFIELALPLLVLTTLGIRGLGRRLRQRVGGISDDPRSLAAPLLAATLCAVAWTSYVPLRATALARMAGSLEQPFDALDRVVPERAVIFADGWTPWCSHPPTRGWVFSRPNNDPDLSDDLLWANHLTLDIDRVVAQRLQRPGFLLAWTPPCRMHLVPLGSAPGAYPDARLPGLRPLEEQLLADR